MEYQFTTINFPHEKSFIVRHQPYEEYSVIQAHKNYELNLVTSGYGKRIVGNNISKFDRYDLILIGPDLPHSREFTKPDKLPPECLALYISVSLVNSDLIQIPEFEPIRNLFSRAKSGLFFKVTGAKEIEQHMIQLTDLEGIESMIQLIKLLKALTETEEKEIISLTPELPVSSYKDLSQIKTVYDFVVHNLHNRITLYTAAGLLNMAPGSFCRFFKKRTGKSFIQYVKDIRISHAAKLLSDTEMSIAQVSLESGYYNLSNFNFYFKSIMKMTPSEYRKNFVTLTTKEITKH